MNCSGLVRVIDIHIVDIDGVYVCGLPAIGNNNRAVSDHEQQIEMLPNNGMGWGE